MTPEEWTVTGIAERVRAGEISAQSVLDVCLERIAKHNEALVAFVHVNEDLARQDAKRVDQMIAIGQDPGPFAGVPVGVKDIYDAVMGMPTTSGSLLFKDAPPDKADSTHVARLRAAGAVIVGRTATAEFGMDSATTTRAWGTTRNPWNRELTPGGSSGGSAAAVAAGLVPFATASDGGGSTRSPASHCALVGLKPSHGRIPRPNGIATVTVLGGLTKTVRDTARYLDVVSGPHNRDRMTLPPPDVIYEQIIETLEVAGLRAAYSPDLGYNPIESEIIRVTEGAAAELIRIAGLKHVDVPVTFTNVFPDFIKINVDATRYGFIAEGIIPDKQHLLGEKIQRAMKRAEAITPAEVHAARGRLHIVEAEMAALYEHVDIVLTPVTTCLPYGADEFPPEKIAGQDARPFGAENFPLWANITWNPSISVPVGVSKDGLPIGLMITGPRHRDDIVLRLARLFEQAHPWPLEAPAYAANHK